ncbi:MAG TPA: LysR family transcriptional regulator [Firmicutes bacterium]|nr:LysR family transcriptional regulator [Bacillota bacterium]
MDIRVLQYFLIVAREKTISGAAEALHMTQPPLSREMKELENELGKQLFVRGNRKITLTKEGLLLRKRAEEIVSLMEKTKAEVSASSENIRGDIYIGNGETEGMRLLLKTIQQVQAQYPDIHFHFSSGDGYDVTDRLDRGLIDFGTLIEPIDIGKYDYLRLPRPDIWGVLMRKDHPLAALDCIRPADLRDIPLMISRQMAQEGGLSGWLGYDGEELNVVATGNLAYTLAMVVEEGIGCLLTLDQLVDVSAERNLCFRQLEPRLESWMYLAWKKYQVFTSAAEVFVDMLKQNLEGQSDG